MENEVIACIAYVKLSDIKGKVPEEILNKIPYYYFSGGGEVQIVRNPKNADKK